MMMDRLKAIGKKKLFLIQGGILLIIILLVVLNWDRIQYRRAIAEFYDNYGNSFAMLNAMMPSDIQEEYHKEKLQDEGLTFEEYEKKLEEEYKDSQISCKYKILRAENLLRLYKFSPDNRLHITDLEQFKEKMYEHFGEYGFDPDLVKKAYMVEVEVKTERDAGKDVYEVTEHVIVYRYKNEWKFYITIAYDC